MCAPRVSLLHDPSVHLLHAGALQEAEKDPGACPHIHDPRVTSDFRSFDYGLHVLDGGRWKLDLRLALVLYSAHTKWTDILTTT